MQILLPKNPALVSATQARIGKLKLQKNEWEERSKTLLLGFENYSDGVQVNINW